MQILTWHRVWTRRPGKLSAITWGQLCQENKAEQISHEYSCAIALDLNTWRGAIPEANRLFFCKLYIKFYSINIYLLRDSLLATEPQWNSCLDCKFWVSPAGFISLCRHKTWQMGFQSQAQPLQTATKENESLLRCHPAISIRIEGALNPDGQTPVLLRGHFQILFLTATEEEWEEMAGWGRNWWQ